MPSRMSLLLFVSLMFSPLMAQTAPALPNEAIDTPSILPGKHDEVRKADNSAPKGPKRIWASSYLWAKAPELTVEKWLTEQPDMKGKYVLIELFNTWCTHCWTSVPNLNRWHAEYKDELVVIGLCDEPAEIVQAAKKEINRDFYFAIDTQKRMRKALDVRGVPHAILLEPGGYVIWEGYPHLPGHELTDKTIEAALAVGRRLKADKGKQAQR
ncbi:MAG: TlpA disulfide reductase family protein [Kiritimatiellia bacterium]|jgi:thiol-disulfide isomerase/thioredoxin|nr:TlpA disulfide reductase family protein [Kiritimatiellia bacterium]MDP6847724.1 TlpA disulfide reductase family protein [Kiritimatiellia bacterium]